jgi:polyisoprenoid-binding protein YceI
MSTTSTETKLPVGTWQLDPAHSRAEFSIVYMGGTFRGTFQPFEAELEVGDDDKATLAGKARAESIQVNDENLNAHLQTPDFFDTERFPEISFSSKNVSIQDGHILVDGELTIRGQAQPVKLEGTIVGPLTDGYGRERITLELSSKIDRTAFGIDWNMPLPSGEPALTNDVVLSAELFFIKA